MNIEEPVATGIITICTTVQFNFSMVQFANAVQCVLVYRLIENVKIISTFQLRVETANQLSQSN